jgi:hypothetical protein
VTVKIEQNVTHGLNLLVALIVLSIAPDLMVIYHIGFERRRWSRVCLVAVIVMRVTMMIRFRGDGDQF